MYTDHTNKEERRKWRIYIYLILPYYSFIICVVLSDLVTNMIMMMMRCGTSSLRVEISGGGRCSVGQLTIVEILFYYIHGDFFRWYPSSPKLRPPTLS